MTWSYNVLSFPYIVQVMLHETGTPQEPPCDWKHPCRLRPSVFHKPLLYFYRSVNDGLINPICFMLKLSFINWPPPPLEWWDAVLQKRLAWALFCFIVINPGVLSSANRVDLGFFCLINFPILLPPPENGRILCGGHSLDGQCGSGTLIDYQVGVFFNAGDNNEMGLILPCFPHEITYPSGVDGRRTLPRENCDIRWPVLRLPCH